MEVQFEVYVHKRLHLHTKAATIIPMHKQTINDGRFQTVRFFINLKTFSSISIKVSYEKKFNFPPASQWMAADSKNLLE